MTLITELIVLLQVLNGGKILGSGTTLSLCFPHEIACSGEINASLQPFEITLPLNEFAN